uniref:Uncharacterized protein n=1 Tax=Leishmania guyanensis TaxID=5670 RepID=A0A1E1J2Q3_LEIGU
MRPSRMHLCTSPVHPWVSEYLARAVVAPAVSASAHRYKGTSRLKSGQADVEGITESERAVLQAQYREARKQLVGALLMQPFSYNSILARASGSSPTALADMYDLRGLCSAAYDFLQESPNRDPTAQQSASCASEADMPPSESAPVTVVSTDAGPAGSAKRLSSSTTSVAGAPAAAVVRWPTVSQMTKAVERRIMDYRYVWRTANRLASDRVEVEQKRCVLASPSDATQAPTTPIFTGGSLPFLLATIPHNLLFSIAEHAILHAWYGGPHVYPNAKIPNPNSAFDLNDNPLLRVDDVTSLQWDRAQAADFLVVVLRQPAVQRELRQRLWGAAQSYHRSVIRKLESLGMKRRAEGVSKDAADNFFILLDQEPGMPTPLSVSLREIRDDLFSFDEHMYFVRVSPSSYSSPWKCRVDCQPLRSTHLFRFVSSHADVVAAFRDRPRSNVSDALFRFSSLDGNTSAKASAAPVSLSTRDKLWLLLSEMVRLRYLVAYLLNLEVILHQVRNNHSRSQREQPAPKEVDRASFPASRHLEQADVQDAENANCIAAVFHFLGIRIHPRLAVSSHHHRFLRLARVRHCERPTVSKPPGASTAAHEASDAGMSVTHEDRRYRTVQELFSAFSKALDAATVPLSQPQATVASYTPSAKSACEGQGAPGDGIEVMSDVLDHMRDSSGLQSVAQARNVSDGSSLLSDTDTEFLKAILSVAPEG